MQPLSRALLAYRANVKLRSIVRRGEQAPPADSSRLAQGRGWKRKAALAAGAQRLPIKLEKRVLKMSEALWKVKHGNGQWVWLCMDVSGLPS
jgi:hypothetical protein